MRVFFKIRLLLIKVFVLILLTACGASDNALPGTKLAGTEDVLVHGDWNFSISPNGRWMTYLSEDSSLNEPIYILYNLETQEKRIVTLSAKMVESISEGKTPTRRSPCWSEDSSQFHLIGNFLLFTADVSSQNPQWMVSETYDNAMFNYVYNCPRQNQNVDHLVRVDRISDLEVAIVQVTNNQVLARHKTSKFGVTYLAVEYFAHSPNANYVGYIVSELRGSFSGDSWGYIVSLLPETSANPILVSLSPLGPFRWGIRDESFYGVTSENQSKEGIYQWNIQG